MILRDGGQLGGPRRRVGLAGADLAVELALRLRRDSRAALPDLPDLESADAVLVLGEDVTNSAPRIALALGKSLFYRQLEKGIAAAYTDAAQTMACNMMDETALEGVQAFIEKRRPDWRG